MDKNILFNFHQKCGHQVIEDGNNLIIKDTPLIWANTIMVYTKNKKGEYELR